MNNYAVIDGIKREIRSIEEVWYECQADKPSGASHRCQGRAQQEGTDPRTGQAVLIVQVCKCDCHNRTKKFPKIHERAKEAIA